MTRPATKPNDRRPITERSRIRMDSRARRPASRGAPSKAAPRPPRWPPHNTGRVSPKLAGGCDGSRLRSGTPGDEGGHRAPPKSMLAYAAPNSAPPILLGFTGKRETKGRHERGRGGRSSTEDTVPLPPQGVHPKPYGSLRAGRTTQSKAGRCPVSMRSLATCDAQYCRPSTTGALPRMRGARSRWAPPPLGRGRSADRVPQPLTGDRLAA